MKKLTQERYFHILGLFEDQPKKRFTYRELSRIMGLNPRIIEHVMKYLINAKTIIKFPNLLNMRECYFLLNQKQKQKHSITRSQILINTLEVI